MKNFAWTYPEVTDSGPVHVLRVVYDIEKQTATFPVSDRVKIVFEEFKGSGSVYLDAFFTLSDQEIIATEESCIVAAHRLGDHRWVYFTVTPGAPQPVLPENISDMTLHIGEVENEADGTGTTRINATGLWYSVPESSGTLVLFEASFERFSLIQDSP